MATQLRSETGIIRDDTQYSASLELEIYLRKSIENHQWIMNEGKIVTDKNARS